MKLSGKHTHSTDSAIWSLQSNIVCRLRQFRVEISNAYMAIRRDIGTQYLYFVEYKNPLSIKITNLHTIRYPTRNLPILCRLSRLLQALLFHIFLYYNYKYLLQQFSCIRLELPMCSKIVRYYNLYFLENPHPIQYSGLLFGQKCKIQTDDVCSCI